MLFSLKKTRVKPGTVLIETLLSGDYLYSFFPSEIAFFHVYLKYSKLSIKRTGRLST